MSHNYSIANNSIWWKKGQFNSILQITDVIYIKATTILGGNEYTPAQHKADLINCNFSLIAGDKTFDQKACKCGGKPAGQARPDLWYKINQDTGNLCGGLKYLIITWEKVHKTLQIWSKRIYENKLIAFTKIRSESGDVMMGKREDRIRTTSEKNYTQ